MKLDQNNYVDIAEKAIKNLIAMKDKYGKVGETGYDISDP